VVETRGGSGKKKLENFAAVAQIVLRRFN